MNNKTYSGPILKTAITEAPKVCTCERKLGKPVCGPTEASPVYHHESKWHVACACGNVWIWGYLKDNQPGYVKSHIWPLGRSAYGCAY